MKTTDLLIGAANGQFTESDTARAYVLSGLSGLLARGSAELEPERDLAPEETVGP